MNKIRVYRTNTTIDYGTETKEFCGYQIDPDYCRGLDAGICTDHETFEANTDLWLDLFHLELIDEADRLLFYGLCAGVADLTESDREFCELELEQIVRVKDGVDQDADDFEGGVDALLEHIASTCL